MSETRGRRSQIAASSRSSAARTDARRTRAPADGAKPFLPDHGRRPRRAQPNQTRPTGFSAEPPSGPAIPVTLTATSAGEALSAPSAIARAVASLTAPCGGERRRRHAEQLDLGFVRVDDEAPLDDRGRAGDLGQERRRSARRCRIPPSRSGGRGAAAVEQGGGPGRGRGQVRPALGIRASSAASGRGAAFAPHRRSKSFAQSGFAPALAAIAGRASSAAWRILAVTSG